MSREDRDRHETEATIEACTCKSCGQLNEKALAWVNEMRDNVTVLQDKLTQEFKTVKALRRDADSQLRKHRLFPTALRVLEYWQAKCHPEARELEGRERLTAVLGRLSGKPKAWSEADLKRCVDGYAMFAYVVDGRRCQRGSPADRRVDAELIFRDAKRVAQGIAFAEEAERRQQPMPAVAADANSRLSDLGKAAVAVAEFGWYVFPLQARGKHPVTKHGLKDATRDVAKITEFWLKHPNFNIGVRCGIESEIIVVDVDDRNDGLESLRELETKHGPLPETLTIITPGGGTHYYLRHPGGEIRNTAGFPGLGIDIRGDGGYCVCPPSVGENGRCYEVDNRVPAALAPAWLIEMLLKRQTAYEKIDPSEWETMISMGVQSGERNNQLTRLTGYLWHRHEPQIVLGLLLSVNRARCSPPLPDQEVRKIVDSIGRREQRKKAAETRRGVAQQT